MAKKNKLKSELKNHTETVKASNGAVASEVLAEANEKNAKAEVKEDDAAMKEAAEKSAAKKKAEAEKKVKAEAKAKAAKEAAAKEAAKKAAEAKAKACLLYTSDAADDL